MNALPIVGALLLAGCGYFPEVAIDLQAGARVTAGTLEVCPAPGRADVNGCDAVAGRMGTETFGVGGDPGHARFVFDRSTPSVVRVVTALGYADFRLATGDVLRIAAAPGPGGTDVTIDCTNPAFVCGSAQLAVCQPPPTQCP